MYVIAGLGNPGKEYEKTRHNMGFLVLDRIAEESGIPISRTKHNAMIGKGTIGGEQVMLVKPMTYMNDSGRSLGEIFRYYDVEPEKMIVIYDDMDLEPGAIRIRKKGSAGSHNGMKSVVSHLGVEDFPRIRVGIGGTRRGGWIDHVLEKVSKEEQELLKEGVEKATKAAIAIVEMGIDRAMNRYNSRPKKQKKPKEPATDGE